VRGWLGDADVLPWLKERATDDESPSVRQVVLRNLARSWKDEADTLPWLKARGARDDHEAVQEAVLEELARGWRDDPETLAWLQGLRYTRRPAGFPLAGAIRVRAYAEG
jgi:hypothetical protein